MNKKQNKFIINRYVSSMVLVLLFSLIALPYYFAVHSMITRHHFSGTTCLLFVVPWLVVILAACLSARQLWGVLVITDHALEIHAFPQKPLVLPFEDIHYMGIYYDQIDTGKQYWVCFAKEIDIISENKHRMIKVPYTQGII